MTIFLARTTRDMCMRNGTCIFIFALLRLAAAQDTLHVYYYGGESIEQMNISGVTVTLSVKDNGRFNQVAIYVDNRSSEAAAGLSIGNVITELDGSPIRSTDDLSAALSQKEPGTRVNITYLFHPNLGWMAKQTSLILARGE